MCSETANHVVRPLAVYFILNNRIYQSPDVYSLVSNRLVSAHVQTSLGGFIEPDVIAHLTALTTKINGHPPIAATSIHATYWLCVAHRRAICRRQLREEAGSRRGGRSRNARHRGCPEHTRSGFCRGLQTATKQHAALQRNEDDCPTCTGVFSIASCSVGRDRSGNPCYRTPWAVVHYPGTWPGRRCYEGSIHRACTTRTHERSARRR